MLSSKDHSHQEVSKVGSIDSSQQRTLNTMGTVEHLSKELLARTGGLVCVAWFWRQCKVIAQKWMLSGSGEGVIPGLDALNKSNLENAKSGWGQCCHWSKKATCILARMEGWFWQCSCFCVQTWLWRGLCFALSHSGPVWCWCSVTVSSRGAHQRSHECCRVGTSHAQRLLCSSSVFVRSDSSGLG